MTKSIRGFNANAETSQILEELNIPKMQFSKTLNNIVKEWHSQKKQQELEEKQDHIEVILDG